MKLLFITPGTGSYHCGVCMKENALVLALRNMGHDAVMLPMYLPHILDEPPADKDQPMFFGGINAYLQLKYSFFRHVPKWLDKVLDSRKLLAKVAKAQKGNMTAGREISEMALSTFQGEDGPLAKEFRHLVQWAVEKEKADVIYLSTAMQLGLVPAIKRLGEDIPVYCSLQGEDTFLESLVQPYRDQIWELMREAAKSVELFLSPSQVFAGHMSGPLQLNDDQVAIVPNGINLDGYSPRSEPSTKPVIGYLARMNHLKGLDILVDAFIHLHKSGTVPGCELRIAGTTLPDDQAYIDSQASRLDDAGLQEAYSIRPNISREEKIEFLRELTVLSVPTRYGEAFGLYVIEAMAAGVPVVQPNHGAFPEIIETTGGGATCEPENPQALADALTPWLLDLAHTHATGLRAHAAVKEHYSIQRHAEGILRLVRVPA